MLITIYIIGYIIAFITGRYYLRTTSKKNGYTYGWIEVILNTVFSLFSFGMIIIWIGIYILTQLGKITLKEPPKWL